MKKFIIGLVFVAVLAIAIGCTQKPIGGDKDEHGCLIAAGYSWCPSTQQCQRVWETYCEEFKEQYRGNETGGMTEAEARSIAANSECGQSAQVKNLISHDINGKYWRFDLDPNDWGDCVASCLVNEVNNTAQIDLMCSTPHIGGDKDEHGCLIAAGYSWCPSTEKCQRMWETYCEEYKDAYRGNETGGMSAADAKTIAESNPTCTNVGSLKDTAATYNPNSMTWWFDLNAVKEGCNPACVVYAQNSSSEVNWRCTGLINPANKKMSQEEARAVAENSDCMKAGNLTDKYEYNNFTNSWWITMTGNCTAHSGCNWACVVDGATKTAELTWEAPAAY